MLYKLLDGLSRLWNKAVMVPCLKRSLNVCGKSVSIGRRFEIAGTSNISMGHDVYIGPSSTILTTKARLKIGNYVMAGPNLTIITGDHRTDLFDKPMMMIAEDEKLPENDQDVIIGNDVWLGSSVTVLKGVSIADHCVVASGAVVITNVEPPYSIWGGVPARLIAMREVSRVRG